MIRYYLLILGFSLCGNTQAQVLCSANADSGSGYSAVLTSGLDLENPDCVHPGFGPHITQLYDEDLARNVFVFHSHIETDNDRCLVFDRVRMEIKGGPDTDLESQHTQDATSYYRWKFRLDDNFMGASSFCHIFQNKAFGGLDSSFPIITITARASILEVRHNGGDTGADLGVLATADLSRFRGKWVEVYLRQISSENGQIEITIKDMNTGLILLEYQNNDIDLWREGAEYNRPKWGMYRLKGSSLQDEEIRFADFCISETDSALCPEEAVLVSDTTPPSAPANLTASTPTITTVDLGWEEATDDFGVVDYLILQDEVEVATTTALTTSITNLNGGTTYVFTVLARDEAGNTSAPSNAVTITTDPTDALPNVATNPFPADTASQLSTSVSLSWTGGSNTTSFRLKFGTVPDPPEVSNQATTDYTPSLAANTTYYWQVIAINENGETPGPVWSFTTGETINDLPWFVYRANARMEEETNFWELESEPSAPIADEVIIDPLVPTNNFYSYRDDSDDKFRWRSTLNAADTSLTIVARMEPFSDQVNGMCHFEVRAFGWRQKVRLNDNSIKLEASTPVVERALDFDWNDGMHLFRMVVKGNQTTIYLDENPAPFLLGNSDETSTANYFYWGKGGGSDYGTSTDWLAFLPNEDYAPGEGPPLPEDLILSNDATLASLSINGTAVVDFSPSTFDYTIDLAEANLPELSWMTNSPLASVEVNNPSNSEGTQASLVVIAQDGYSENTYTLDYLITDLSEMELNDWLRIFPNPVTNQLQIFLSAGETGTAAIFNQQGVCVKRNLLIDEQTVWDVAALPTGTYLLRIQLSGQRTQMRKIVVY